MFRLPHPLFLFYFTLFTVTSLVFVNAAWQPNGLHPRGLHIGEGDGGIRENNKDSIYFNYKDN